MTTIPRDNEKEDRPPDEWLPPIDPWHWMEHVASITAYRPFAHTL